MSCGNSLLCLLHPLLPDRAAPGLPLSGPAHSLGPFRERRVTHARSFSGVRCPREFLVSLRSPQKASVVAQAGPTHSSGVCTLSCGLKIVNAKFQK